MLWPVSQLWKWLRREPKTPTPTDLYKLEDLDIEVAPETLYYSKGREKPSCPILDTADRLSLLLGDTAKKVYLDTVKLHDLWSTPGTGGDYIQIIPSPDWPPSTVTPSPDIPLDEQAQAAGGIIIEMEDVPWGMIPIVGLPTIVTYQVGPNPVEFVSGVFHDQYVYKSEAIAQDLLAIIPKEFV